jgi:hypothetical protein
VRAAEDGRRGPLPTLGEAIARPFADAAERSVPVSKTGDGQSGMRTEQITLEVTHDLDARLSDWIVEVVDEWLGPMESVRVVEEIAQAASGGGVSSSQPISGAEKSAVGETQEPVAWMCEWTDHTELYGSKIQAERAAAGDVVPQPLYRQPSPPEGNG